MRRGVDSSSMRIFADYNHFNVFEQGSDEDLAKPWTPVAVEDRVAGGRTFLGIGTEHRDNVTVDVEILSRVPPDDFDSYDHVSEASLETRTGRLTCAGPTSSEAPERSFVVEPGSWQVRVSHSGLAGPDERIRIQLWPGPPVPVRVVKRWQPTPPGKTERQPDGPITNRFQASARAWQGDIDAAFAALQALADQGDAGAAASVAEILAFRGRWAELVPYGLALVANPTAVSTGNVFSATSRFLRRAARELDDPAIVTAAASKVPPGHRALAPDPPDPAAKPEDRPHFEKALALAAESDRFEGQREELEYHCFALAVSYNVSDEILKRWNPRFGLGFQNAVPVARVLAMRGDPGAAWKLLAEMLPTWRPVDPTQIGPAELLTDPVLAPVITPDRGEEILRTPRGPAVASA